MQGDPRIIGCVPAGSGASVVHSALTRAIQGYGLETYPPAWEYCPPLLWRLGQQPTDLVHAPPDHAVFACRRGTPLVVTFHNYVLDSAMRPFSSRAQCLHYATDLRLFTRLALRRAQAVTAVSAFTAALVREDMRFTGAIEVIPNGVDTGRFSPAVGEPTDGPLQVLFSGNLTRRKGADLLPEIARLAGPDVEIHYTTGARAGIGDPRWAGLKAIGRVPHADMPALYRQFDVLLLPTVREGMSLALLEAMASGLAVVASDAASNPELIERALGGLLCPVGEPEAYAAALRTLAADRERVRRMGQHNRRVVECRYTLERMVEGYRAVFERVLGRPVPLRG
ncbi:glycosyltransferase family 4 protein [Extensimonas perlucida]|uniref:glycosyltransferase family 4 protein n=1 Tax=Extensimonas perlucida TaxID=2590786 RepID=UPI001642F5D4|nr:glycosyltransferase family 4 protein [Extensimonas perlucida]